MVNDRSYIDMNHQWSIRHFWKIIIEIEHDRSWSPIMIEILLDEWLTCVRIQVVLIRINLSIFLLLYDLNHHVVWSNKQTWFNNTHWRLRKFCKNCCKISSVFILALTTILCCFFFCNRWKLKWKVWKVVDKVEVWGTHIIYSSELSMQILLYLMLLSTMMVQWIGHWNFHYD